MTPKTKTYSLEDLRSLASDAYAATLAELGDAAPDALLPALAKREIAAKTGVPISRLASIVDPVYFRRNGERNPLPLEAAKTEKSLAKALAKRRNAGGTLGRWDTLRASAATTLGRSISESAVRALVASAGVDLDSSYLGRGTRVGAPSTRTSEIAEVRTDEDDGES